MDDFIFHGAEGDEPVGTRADGRIMKSRDRVVCPTQVNKTQQVGILIATLTDWKNYSRGPRCSPRRQLCHLTLPRPVPTVEASGGHLHLGGHSLGQAGQPCLGPRARWQHWSVKMWTFEIVLLVLVVGE